jgi:hypothetical protein
MFVSLTKTLKKFCGFRLGFGIRITKKNAVWMWIVLLFVSMFQLMWYMFVLCGWLLYAYLRLVWWLVKMMFTLIPRGFRWLWRKLSGVINKLR